MTTDRYQLRVKKTECTCFSSINSLPPLHFALVRPFYNTSLVYDRASIVCINILRVCKFFIASLDTSPTTLHITRPSSSLLSFLGETEYIFMGRRDLNNVSLLQSLYRTFNSPQNLQLSIPRLEKQVITILIILTSTIMNSIGSPS